MTIRARGKKNKKDLSVVYVDGEYFFNGDDNEAYLGELKMLLKEGLPVFGTYISRDPEDNLNIIGILREYFFDKEVEVKSDPEIHPDWEEGTVY